MNEMDQFNPKSPEFNGLFLRGRLQVEIASAALNAVNMPSDLLAILLKLDDDRRAQNSTAAASSENGVGQDIVLSLPDAAPMKQSIISGTYLLEQDTSVRFDTRVAAAELRQILTKENIK